MVVKNVITKVIVYINSRSDSGVIVEGRDLKVINKAEEVMEKITFPQTLVVADGDKINVIAVFREWSCWKDVSGKKVNSSFA